MIHIIIMENDEWLAIFMVSHSFILLSNNHAFVILDFL